MAINLCTLAQVKTWLGIGGSSEDDRINLLIPYVSRRLERAMGRVDGVEQRSRTEFISYVPEIPSGKVWGYTTNVAPISSVTSVVVDESHVYSGASATTLTEDEDFRVKAAQGRIEFEGYRPPEGHDVVRLIYVAGFATDTTALIANEVYADLNMAAIMQVAYVFDRRNSLGVTSESVNGESRSQPGVDLLPDVASLLRPYVRRRLC